MKRLAMLFWPALMLAACSTPSPSTPSPAPPPQAAAPVQSSSPPSQPAKPMQVAATPSPMLAFEQALSTLNGKSLYFDYDKYAIKPDEDALVLQHARLLETYPSDSVTLQGNCDERGSSEYNLALGQRRADAVKQRLVLLGVPASRIETVSFGKEKPRETCHAESCWKVNRRADFVDSWSQQKVTTR
jgi:peptidoglycan-associated lipoprotein